MRSRIGYCGLLVLSFAAFAGCASKQKHGDHPAAEAGAAAPPLTPPAPTAGPNCQCFRQTECPANYVCQGPEGCDAVWTCVPPRPCTRDLVAYCGCDGKTFFGSSTCPSAPFAHRGTCENAPGAVPP